MTARQPGTVGAVLESDAVAAEIICDGYHVHPSLVATAIKSKTARLAMAITDGTAGAGMREGSRASIGGRPIIVTQHAAVLEDGTLAGSILTMDGAFRVLLQSIGVSIVDAARLCATTQAERLGLSQTGRLAVGLMADLAVLGPDRRVRQTYISGVPALPAAP
jgi:N-acetylglucosamine-6-phosphate deacetylase